ncbi:hypothetical protein EV363DRAFT_1444547 [Boletus edulis]|nr:hypothetical protein EV363DRAFT_1444547 [Boletus edulis]
MLVVDARPDDAPGPSDHTVSDTKDLIPPTEATTHTEDHTEAVSVHSLPVGHVAALDSPPQRPSTARSPPSSDTHASHTAQPQTQSSTVSVEPAGDRSSRRRSAMEPLRFNNRLSGFFSNLIHRRDTITSPNSHSMHEEPPTTPVAVQSAAGSRIPSPAPVRSLTPPPPLPPPTLTELGLSLTAVTPDLFPSHFSSPPASGAFLAPHYLLLCHAQGLDVLPLISPPAPQPYALVRRVAFKSVVVMEHRGVLVAIAGRRDGVRVYALEEVKKAVEWRIDVEVRRERERSRREVSKRAGSGNSSIDQRDSSEKRGKISLSAPPITEVQQNSKFAFRSSSISGPAAPKKPRLPTIQSLSSFPPAGLPPPYTSVPDNRPPLRNQQSSVSVSIARSRRSSLSLVVVPSVPPLSPSISNVATVTAPNAPEVSKNSDWLEGSDDEAIDILTAGASGSQALDERTSSIPPPRNDGHHHSMNGTTATLPVRTHAIQSHRRNRLPNFGLNISRTNALQTSPSAINQSNTIQTSYERSSQQLSPDMDPDEDDDDTAAVPGERITLAQALLESRLPELPPAGTARPQEAVLIHASIPETGEDGFHATSSFPDALSSHNRSISSRPERRRRRWSVLGSIFNPSGSQDMRTSPPHNDMPLGSSSAPPPPIPENEGRPLARSFSTRTRSSATTTGLVPRPSSSGGSRLQPASPVPPIPTVPSTLGSAPSNRLLPRFFSTAFSSRRSDVRPPTLALKNTDMDPRKNVQPPPTPQAPPPKLEYVKLPGTKGSLLIKAVETQRKSFLAILCGENGEKVELFAGTYRTALGLSRTFILPDSPKSLELQLQGDDLVEVFLVFSQNVFGLEPATVRVREVRIGRAERRAARRRVREIRNGQTDLFDTDPQVLEDEDNHVNLNLSIGITVPPGQESLSRNDSAAHLPEGPNTPTGSSTAHDSALAHAEELVALASAQVGPYTTFQQLSFAPKIPLSTIADDYIIPPTYGDFLGYRAEHEPDTYGDGRNLASIQFSPPGLPMPAPAPPSRWFYRDPKGVVHGPWKSSLMQAWYKDGLLPPGLPVRKEEDNEYTLLRDLRQQCVDPVHPFRSAAPLAAIQPSPPLSDASKPLLPPVSLLVQPRHFGPPALFFSSRGGHSTSIVDARGRSVLRGRFLWSADDEIDSKLNAPRMGDIKRLEAFDVKERSVIVAMRQGGLEAMDLGDALLKPADDSRTVLPYFLPSPSNINRRGPFVWKIGTPVDPSTGGTALSARAKTGYLGRKGSYPSGKPSSKGDFTAINDGDQEFADEIVFLGRTDDDLYLCERNGGAFRILRLSPDE